TDGTVDFAKRVSGVDSTIATASLGAEPSSWLYNTWLLLSVTVAPTTDTLHPPAGGLWAVVSLGGTPWIDQLVDSAPNWSGACAGIGTFGTQAAFDDFLVT